MPAPPIDEAEAQDVHARAIHVLGILEERGRNHPVPLSAMNCGDGEKYVALLISLLLYIHPRIAPSEVGEMAAEHFREVH